MKATAVQRTVPKRDFLSIVDIQDRLEPLLETARRLKKDLRGPRMLEVDNGRNRGLIF